MMRSIGFIGAGTVATALAIRLREKGYPIVAVASRSRSSAENLAQAVEGCSVCDDGQRVSDVADLVFITTPDDAISSVVNSVKWRSGQGVIHCSGADSALALEPAKAFGAEVGSFHPLQTFASVSYAVDNLPGSTFAIEAEGNLLDELKGMAEVLNGHVVELKSEDKVLYHAAAVLACNYTVTLTKLATDLWETFGVSTPEATKSLMPLMRGTINNLDNVGLPNCLTGPVARGDLGTIRKHLDALASKAPHLLPAYRELGLQTIPIALAKGKIKEEQASQLHHLLTGSATGG